MIDRIAAGEDEVAPLFWKQPKADAEFGEDEGELADLRQACRDDQRGADGISEQRRR